MTRKIEELTSEQKKAVCIAFLASSNSVHDLCTMLIEALHGERIAQDPYEDFFNTMVEQFQQDRKDAPESFETSIEDELNVLLATAADHEYEANSPVWG